MAAAAAASHRLRIWWKSRGGDLGVVVAWGLGILFVAFFFFALGPRIRGSTDGGSPIALLGHTGEDLVPLTLLPNAGQKGAVCLDGTAPGYHIDWGFGSGVDSWLIHLEGGGWCDSVQSCAARKKTVYGSSSLMESQVSFRGILSSNQTQNPDFYNWNRVKIRYCDGGSFSGNVESEVHNGTEIFFRGQRIWEAVMDHLMVTGLATARQALLTGCSAGGLATFIHCDDFRARLSGDVTVKCFSDAGFFLDEKDILGGNTIRSFFNDVVQLQGIANNLPKDCTRRQEPSQCFFPREFITSITTPLFVLNPTYDFWQIQHVLAPPKSDPNGLWFKCKKDIANCDSNQMEALHVFRRAFLNALKDFRQMKDGGLFLNSCFIHCQTLAEIMWHSPTSPRIGNKTIATAVGDWYFGRGVEEAVDGEFPCNPTCYNIKFT